MNKKIFLVSVVALSAAVFAGEKKHADKAAAKPAATTATTATTTTATSTAPATEVSKDAKNEMKYTLMGATDANKTEIENLAKAAGAKNAHYHNGTLKIGPVTGFDAAKFTSSLKEKLPSVTVQN